MGKKKSVVFMVLLTIVIVALCVLTAIPTFPVPGTVEKWTPAIWQYDLGSDLGGGYYAYYYPEGVISETEYKNNYAAKLEEGQDQANEYEADYTPWKGLYLSTDEKDNVYSGNPESPASEEFKQAFANAAKEIDERFKSKGYSDYRVAVVDDYSLRIELPASATDSAITLQYLVKTGDITMEKGGETIDALKKDGAKVSDLIKSVSVATKYKTSYLKIKLTDAGEEMISSIKSELSAAPTDSSSDTSSLTTLDIKLGEETLLQVYQDNVMDNDKEIRTFFVDQENKAQVETVKILLESVLENGGFDLSLTAGEVRNFEPVYGEKTLNLLYIAVLVALVALLVLPIVKMGRFGVVSGYATLSYLIIVGLCYAFITGAAFEVTLGSIFVFLAVLVLVHTLQYRTYNAIKAEFELGKTVESSVKGGYRKTVFGVVDIYAVLLLGALAMLIGAASLHTLALQTIICVVSGAFINLLWARAINFTFLSASKNKYKYFRFVREDDDDE